MVDDITFIVVGFIMSVPIWIIGIALTSVAETYYKDKNK